MIRKILFVLLALIGSIVALLAWSYQGAIGSVSTDQKVVALTFDDGPNPPHTEALLDLLDSHNVRATFFPKGRNVEAFPELLRAVAERGHEIGNHSVIHRPMLAFGTAGMRDEVEQANQLIEQLIGVRPVLFRPPFGAQGIGLSRALRELGMLSILTSAAGNDWELTDPVRIAQLVLADVEPGGIILLHDGHGDIDDPLAQDSRAPSVAATEIILQTLTSRGYRFVTVGELLELKLP